MSRFIPFLTSSHLPLIPIPVPLLFHHILPYPFRLLPLFWPFTLSLLKPLLISSISTHLTNLSSFSAPLTISSTFPSSIYTSLQNFPTTPSQLSSNLIQKHPPHQSLFLSSPSHHPTHSFYDTFPSNFSLVENCLLFTLNAKYTIIYKMHVLKIII